MNELSHRCPICTKKAIPQMKGLLGYWYCNDCRLGWLKKIPNALYKETYYASGSSLIAKIFAPIGDMFLTIRESYAGSTKKKIWIDVGAGEGNFLAHVHAKKKIGVEISNAGRKTMRQKGLHVMTNNEFLKTTKRNADVISFWHVLEHMVNPEDYLRIAAKNLASQGKIIIGVPNGKSFELSFFKNYWFHLAPQYHIWFFSPEALEKMLAKVGLVTEQVDYWAIEHHFAGTLQSCINATTHTDNLLHKLIRRKQDLSSVKSIHIAWILFWCTLGLPIVILLWITSSVCKRPGAFVLVAKNAV